MIFKLMYSVDDAYRDINDVVDIKIKTKHLEWALKQLYNTLKPNKRI